MHEPTTQELAERLTGAGIQPTAQRLAIFRYVATEADHPTAEDVKRWMDRNFPKVSLATVYNTLNLLVQAGQLRAFRFPHTDKMVYDHNTAHHYHFLDEESGELLDIPEDRIEVRHDLGAGYDVHGVQVVLHGRRR